MEPDGHGADRESAPGVPAAFSGTKLQIVEAALETLKAQGVPRGKRPRDRRHRGGFNQALIFYHFGSVQNATAGGA